jgi:hypothetical protein
MEKDLLKGFAGYLEPQEPTVRDGVNHGFPSVTISRQMGAGGIEVAALLADRLTNNSERVWTVFDRNLAELLWKNQDLPAPVFRGQDPRVAEYFNLRRHRNRKGAHMRGGALALGVADLLTLGVLAKGDVE